MAQIGWIDFSKTHKDKALAVLAMLKKEGSIDELGIGIVRDAFADLLFPGLSTIQTRAKYYYIVTSILLQYAQLSVNQRKRKPLAKFLEEKERVVMYRLGEIYGYQEGYGVIGITKRKGETLARSPSAIYWNGLNKFGFIRYHQYSLSAYLNRFAKYDIADEMQFIPSGDDDPSDDAGNQYDNLMGIYAPYNEQYEGLESLDLTKEESEDFERRIISNAPDSLLAALLQNDGLSKHFLNMDYSGRANYFHFAPGALKLINNERLADTVARAHDFSLALHGAHITYNQAVKRALGEEDMYEDFWQNWLQSIEDFICPDKLTPGALYQIAPRMQPHTRYFLTDWIKLIQEEDFASNKRFELVEAQEYHNKKHKARLRNRNFEGKDKDQWLGFGLLDYRYNNAKTILKDIQSAI